MDENKILELFVGSDRYSMCMLIGSLISSDNNMSKDEISRNLEILRILSKRKDDIFVGEDMERYSKIISDGIEILEFDQSKMK